MGLEEYNRKRDFSQTQEPQPKQPKRTHKKTLSFVVQLHEASHLHYDFRLEWGGVLKSWAVPKGPSMNPAEKRLAVMVEDHPLEYGTFEGEIPEGNYGAGMVEIWDKGVWEPAANMQDVDKALEDGLLEFNLQGEKLSGMFKLIEMKKSSVKNGWLLIKKRD